MTTFRPVIRMNSLVENDTAAAEYHKHLSPFQMEKFTYMFDSLFDLDKNLLLEEADIHALVSKMKAYCKWDDNDEKYQYIKDVHKVFYECLQDQVRSEKAASAQAEEIKTWEEALKVKKIDVSQITLQQWLNMWGRLCHRASGLNDFPIWVQLLPKIFFEIIDQDKDGILEKDEYERFYREFVAVPSTELQKVVDEGYRAMTADGEYTFDLEHYGFCFANFLLGRSIYGPGKYIFGVFDNSDINQTYKINYNEED